MNPTEGTLRSWLDGELPPEESRAVEEFLAAHGDARQRLSDLGARRERVDSALAALASQEQPADVPQAWAAFQQASAQREHRVAAVGRRRPWILRPAWGALAASLALFAVLLTSGSARATAQRLLGFLRLRTVTVVTIDRAALFGGMGESRGKLFGDLLSASMTESKKPGDDVVVASAGQASDLAGFQVRLPQARADKPVLKVKANAAFQLKLDRARVQNFLELTGRYDIELPEWLDGATVAIDIPKAVQATYGTCPQRTRHGSADQTANWSDCLLLIQIPTPTVVTAPAFDLGMLAEMGLQVAGMTADDARAIRNRVDWTSSLVIPLPAGDVSHEEVTVDGVPGILVTEVKSRKPLPGYALVWIKRGVTYALTGFGSGMAGVPVADSLP